MQHYVWVFCCSVPGCLGLQLDLHLLWLICANHSPAEVLDEPCPQQHLTHLKRHSCLQCLKP